MSPLLELRNVSVRRGSRLALESVSLSISEGEHVAIVGPNGCGKTTLLKLLARECYPLLQPGSSLRIRGEDTWNIFDLRRHLGLVSNDLMDRCTRDITGFEVVVSGFYGSIGVPPRVEVRAKERERALAVMEQLGAIHLRDRWTDELSSGEARRLLIGRALIHAPSTLVLDEPTTSLDLGAQASLLANLRQLAAAGHSLLLVTHHLEEIIPEIERVVLLQAGRVVFDGRKEDALTEERLRELFGITVHVEQNEGCYRVQAL